MNEEMTGNLSTEQKNLFRSFVTNIIESEKISEKKLANDVGVSQSMVSRAKTRKIDKWTFKTIKLFIYSKNFSQNKNKKTFSNLQGKCKTYVQLGGRENFLVDLLSLLTEEQQIHLFSNSEHRKHQGKETKNEKRTS